MAAIHRAIAEISKDAGALAPQKQGAGVPFAFRGVDQVVSHLAPHLKQHGVIVVPEVLEVKNSSREVLLKDGSPSGKLVTQTELRTRFEFVAVEDGSSIAATTTGLAQDFADRSAAQAQSVAFRVALLQVFSLPTTDKEPEVTGQEVIDGRAAAAAQPGARVTKASSGPNVTELQNKIRQLVAGEYVEETTGEVLKVAGEKIDELGEKISGKKDASWKRSPEILQKVLAEVTKR
jgi:hypothetical protein